MWQSKMETTEFQQLDQFAIVGFKDMAFLFGGKYLNGPSEGETNAIWRLHGDFQWDRESYTLSRPRSSFTGLSNGRNISNELTYLKFQTNTSCFLVVWAKYQLSIGNGTVRSLM